MAKKAVKTGTKETAGPRPLLVNTDPNKETLILPFGVEIPEEEKGLEVKRLPLSGLPEYQGTSFWFVMRPVLADCEARAASLALSISPSEDGKEPKLQFNEAATNCEKFVFACVRWGLNWRNPETGDVEALECNDDWKAKVFNTQAELASRALVLNRQAQVESAARTASAVKN